METKNKILNLIHSEPEKWKHIRKFSRMSKVSPNSVRTYLRILEKNGLVEKKIEGNLLLFRAKLDRPEYKTEKRLYNLKAIYGSGIIDFLDKYYQHRAIVLFGSYSRGEDTSDSDIDIAILTDDKKRPNLSKFEKKLNRKIELSLFTEKEISQEFYNNIINGIVLKGFLKK